MQGPLQGARDIFCMANEQTTALLLLTLVALTNYSAVAKTAGLFAASGQA